MDFAYNDSLKICANTNSTYTVDVKMTISSPGYTTRDFYAKKEIYNNLTTERRLYLLDESQGIGERPEGIRKFGVNQENIHHRRLLIAYPWIKSVDCVSCRMDRLHAFRPGNRVDLNLHGCIQ